MITWIKGDVLNLDGNEITINVGNIGYCIYIGNNRLVQMGIQIHQEVELVVYTLVREDEIRLFGFNSFFSRKVFALLLGVSGVGPKAAINILDKLDPEQIIPAIQNADHGLFLDIPGIGKKTAQRIILDLQGKLDCFLIDLIAEKSTQENPLRNPEMSPISTISLVEDAKSALSNLGFTEREADKAVRNQLKPGIGLNDIIRKSLADLKQ